MSLCVFAQAKEERGLVCRFAEANGLVWGGSDVITGLGQEESLAGVR